jgi:hypothetical protein
VYKTTENDTLRLTALDVREGYGINERSLQVSRAFFPVKKFFCGSGWEKAGRHVPVPSVL